MLDWIFPRRSANHYDDERHWSGGRTSARIKTLAGTQVDEGLALTYAAVWCATRVISETGSSLPLPLYKRLADDGREQASDHPLYEVLKYAPNPDMGSMAFRDGRTMHQVNWGNGFAEVEKDGDRVVALWPIHPARVRPVRPQDNLGGEYKYLVRNNDGTSTRLRADEVLHVPGAFPECGAWGKGVIQYARESIGFGLAVERHGAAFFGSGAQPKGILNLPGMKDPDARSEFRKDWKTIHGSADSHEIMILPVEGTYNQLSLTNEDSQFLQTRVFNKREVATWYRIPPHMIGDLEKATNGTVEQQSLEFVIYGLLPWLRRWEEQVNLKLLTREERGTYYAEHQLAGLLRGDIQARMIGYQKAIMMGVMTINEVRRLENLNSIGRDGDVNYVPLNLTTAERMRTGVDRAGHGIEGKGGMGSDQSGFPAGDDDEQAFDRWTRRQLKRSQRQDLKRQLRDLRRQLAAKPAVPAVSRDAALGVLADALGRMFSVQANAAERAAKGDFDAWLADFFPRHRTTMAEALKPACGVLACVGVKAEPEALAGRLTAASADLLRTAYDSRTPEQFAAMLREWKEVRHLAAAEEILNGRN